MRIKDLINRGVDSLKKYIRLEKVDKIKEGEDYEILVRSKSNHERNILKWTDKDSIGGGSEINDWEPKEYPEGAIVSHNGGIWRSDVDGNEDEPVICDESSSCTWTLLAEVNYEIGIQSIQEGDNISIDNTDPQNPIISALGEEQQFVQITEGGKTGWGLKYRADNPDRYGDIGNNAVDLGFSIGSSSTIGATDYCSTVSGGVSNTASGSFSTVSGGANNIASRQNSTVSGGSNNTASGDYSTVSGGFRNTAISYGEWVGGLFGTTPTGQHPTSFVATNRLFNIGNGITTSLRSDAFTILKNGLATLPSVTNTLIDAEPTGKAVVTKEWSNANFMVNPTLITGYDAGATQTLKNVNGVLTWITD